MVKKTRSSLSQLSLSQLFFLDNRFGEFKVGAVGGTRSELGSATGVSRLFELRQASIFQGIPQWPPTERALKSVPSIAPAGPSCQPIAQHQPITQQPISELETFRALKKTPNRIFNDDDDDDLGERTRTRPPPAVHLPPPTRCLFRAGTRPNAAPASSAPPPAAHQSGPSPPPRSNNASHDDTARPRRRPPAPRSRGLSTRSAS